MIPDDSAAPDEEALFESLLIAYDEALARGEAVNIDERVVPMHLAPRLRSALACISLLARSKKPRATAAPHPSGQHPSKSAIGRFEIMREIGRGGHGVVFLAVDPRLRRLVAIKVPRPEVLVTPDLHRRFLREGRAASLLAHPNLVPIFEVGDDGPLCYIAAGYCEGPSLATWLKQQSSPAPWQESAELVARLADAAAHANARGIVHRDIKPANILLAPADAGSSGSTPLFGQLVVPCLTDFGLARLIDDDASDRTRTGTMLGTPSYMAPEQADGRSEDVGPATDVYALGAVLYELLCGRAPFHGANDLETLRLVSAGQLVRPSALRPGLPRDLEAICLKALTRSTTDRYPTAGALAADLRRFASGEPTEARPLGKLRTTVRWIRRRPARSATVIALLMLLAAIGAGARWYSTRLAAALEASRQADRHRDELRSAVGLRSAWQAFNSDNAAEARAMLGRLDAGSGAAQHGFAWQLLRSLTQEAELLTLDGRAGDVYQVVFSPDGASLATANQDRTVRIWDAATGRSIAALAGHSDEVNAVAWSPDGKLLASASDDGTVRLWDAQTHVAVGPVFDDGRVPIVSVVFSHDGAILASGDDQGRVVLRDTTTWQTVRCLETGGGRVDGLALTQDGGWLATATERKGVQVWNLSTSERPRAHRLFNLYARGVAFDRRGRLLCCGRTWAYYWDWQAGDKPRPFCSSPDYLNSTAFCGEDRLAAVGGQDGAARVFDLATGKLRQTLLGHVARIWCVASSPDGWRLATASADDTVKLWTIPNATAILAYQHPVALNHVAFAADGQTLIATGDGTVERWRLRHVGAETVVPAWHLTDRRSLTIPYIAAHETPWAEARVDASCSDMTLSPDGALAATSRQRSVGVSLVDLRGGNLAGALLAESDERSRAYERSEASHGRPVHTEAIAFSPDGQILVEAVGKSLRLWNVAARRIEQ
ncbi:MAG TPA: serine/threonine-protein kinase, partial [Pirellulales bacterium]|nr:serine/threonine-protein kinase [Pirellulales bacterium]